MAVAGKEGRPMQEEEIQELSASPDEYLGPLGIDWARDIKGSGKPILLVDKALEGRTNLIGGANKEDYHVKNLTPGGNFHPTAYVDLRSVTAGGDLPESGHPPCHDYPPPAGPNLQLHFHQYQTINAAGD